MSLKRDAIEFGVTVAIVGGLLWYAGRRINANGGPVGVVQAGYNAVDGAATEIVTQLPGVSALTDPSTGDFNPAAAGQAAGQATRDWLGGVWTDAQNWWDNLTGNGVDTGNGAGW
ncbi:hypothetical protein [Burkholderia aenigmatica]|uniref:hypothetical protein n=1 Tax=Burkholderia aenigmatica TaxID=2015348 RepID=UPI00265726BF|nr:hypothetical protein [Burkholderia aenigmatica]MDN7873864.1 hypothetical protein [Burkholderia aenigmatica]